MILKDEKRYLKRYLLRHLKEQGLPCSFPTILKYERIGLIPSPRLDIEGFKSKWRTYTGKQIKEIAQIIRDKIK